MEVKTFVSNSAGFSTIINVRGNSVFIRFQDGKYRTSDKDIISALLDNKSCGRVIYREGKTLIVPKDANPVMTPLMFGLLNTEPIKKADIKPIKVEPKPTPKPEPKVEIEKEVEVDEVETEPVKEITPNKKDKRNRGRR